jgi:hypothetical protein
MSVIIKTQKSLGIISNLHLKKSSQHLDTTELFMEFSNNI